MVSERIWKLGRKPTFYVAEVSYLSRRTSLDDGKSRGFEFLVGFAVVCPLVLIWRGQYVFAPCYAKAK